MVKSSFFNQSGSTLVQALVLAAALGGGMTYMMKNTQIQNKVVKQTALKDTHNLVRREINQAMLDPGTCKRTINGPGPTAPEITGDTVITSINESAGTPIYQPGDEIYTVKLGTMKLDMPSTYLPQAGTRSVRANFSFMIMENGVKGVAAEIPLYLFMKDNKVLVCSADDGIDFENNLKQICLELGGTYNSTSGVCERLVGPSGVIRGLIGETFCAPKSSCNTHPYSGRSCSGASYVDVRGVAYGNWAIQSVNMDGTFNCDCIPSKVCPNRADYCSSVDLGTNWCSQDCGHGTKTDPVACPAASPSCTDSSWTPDVSNTCSGTSLTQTSNCGNTRSATGTKTSGSCGTCTDSTWTPTVAASTICTTAFVTETSNCGNTRNNVTKGTKSCDKIACWQGGPLPSNNVCVLSGSCTTPGDVQRTKCKDPSRSEDAFEAYYNVLCQEVTSLSDPQCVKPADASNDCKYKRPLGWSTSGRWGAKNCAEYFSKPGSPAGEGTLADGESSDINGTYASGMTDSGVFTTGGWGTATITCTKGRIVLTNGVCEVGTLQQQ